MWLLDMQEEDKPTINVSLGAVINQTTPKNGRMPG